jgi:hypothetical protein
VKDRVSTAGSWSEPPKGDKRATVYFDDMHASIEALCRIRVNSALRPPVRVRSSHTIQRLCWRPFRHAHEPPHEPGPQRAPLRCLTRSVAGVIALGSLFKEVCNNLSG